MANESAPLTQKILGLLTQGKMVDEFQARSAVAQQAKWGGTICKHIADMGFANEDAMADLVAQAFNLPRARLTGLAADKAALTKVDLAVAQERGIYPFALQDNNRTLWIAMIDPTDLQTVDFVAQKSRCRVRAAYSGENELRAAILANYGQGDEAPPTASGRHRAISLSSVPNIHTLQRMSEAELSDPNLVASAPAAAKQGHTYAPSAAPTSPGMPAVSPPTTATSMLAVKPSGAGQPLEAQLALVKEDLDTTKRVLRAIIEVAVERSLISRAEIGQMVKRLKESGS